MLEYHDREWGVPTHDERELFELLCLEGAQAGLSWSTILNRREGYRAAYDGFDPEAIASYDDARQAELLADVRIIRNRSKIAAFRTNAGATLALRPSGGLDALLWSFVDGRPVVNSWTVPGTIPAETALSATISHELRARGFRFVGPTIVYALMQSAGMVNDHLVACFRYDELVQEHRRGRTLELTQLRCYRLVTF